MPGPWTCIEEWRGIDLLAFSAWSSADKFARIGYEVKVSRSDLRRELVAPEKRARNVEWCNEFYFAVPKGLLKPDEVAFEEPEWEPGDWRGDPCPGAYGRACWPWSRRKHSVEVPVPRVGGGYWNATERITCPTCEGRGITREPRALRESPYCWIPRDVGLIVVNDRCASVVRKAPRREEVPALHPRELGQLVRWISIRPDPRHQPKQQPT